MVDITLHFFHNNHNLNIFDEGGKKGSFDLLGMMLENGLEQEPGLLAGEKGGIEIN